MGNDPYNNKPLDEEVEEELPELPDVQTGGSGELPVLEKGRICPTCQGKARIVSNHRGLSGHCFKCKNSWPLASSALQPVSPVAPERGLSRQTVVEPDWNIAFEEIGAGNDPHRSK